ncbi:hypothetical protein LTR36_000486 [Oleoguttula mirabilis]|uniref:CMP/dCMP-type deaminase domain-containing protein n=1 Tax=Oleoguttula mirabilis TaxID=1507867 RepID=A0AAV9JPK8_9PEZI|nr:hypothetical protein LTR36_000486 [Oleoguttula mirabilis]
MKTDTYLTLCLEQAAKSPLHYRHGCIIVRGGKVIGQGYNDYRPGFNGGALKHGRVAKGGLDGPAIAELKAKLKDNPKPKQKPQQQQQQPDCSKTFTPFEGTGGGHHANVPLSMHSEMMAIHSALAASSTLSSTAFSCEKPSFKLPRGDKRKTRLRAEALKRYSAVLKRAHLDQVVHHQVHNNNNNNKPRKEDKEGRDDEEECLELRSHTQQGPVQHVLKECRRAFHAPQGGEKHHHHQKRKEKEKKGLKHGEGQYEDQYDPYGQEAQQDGLQQPSASKRNSGDTARGYDSTVHDVMTTMSREACASARSHNKYKKDYKRSGKMKALLHDKAPQPELMLLPKGQTGPSTTDRKKHPRLVGADVYVARLGWCRGGPTETSHLPTAPILDDIVATFTTPEVANEGGEASLSSSTASLPSISGSSSGSLHDELLNRDVSPSPATRPTAAARTLDPEIIRASRPCYRCISYMHSVGIKRVFWTTDEGDWEGGKVRDLVDALDSSMESVANGASGGPTGNGVFVTKHEVLMLKRLMGES